MPTLTSTNSRFTLTVSAVFPVPQRIQGYAVDDAFGTESVDVSDNIIGVDGRMSSAYTPFLTKIPVMLQADSPSILTFDQLLAAYQTSQEVFPGSAVISLPGLGKLITLINVVLKSAMQFPSAKKYMQPQPYVFECEQVVVSYQ